jgi:hypothetical protein
MLIILLENIVISSTSKMLIKLRLYKVALVIYFVYVRNVVSYFTGIESFASV